MSSAKMKFWWLFCFGLMLHFTSSQNIVLENNAYKGILVAIAESVPYNSELIPNLKVCPTPYTIIYRCRTKSCVIHVLWFISLQALLNAASQTLFKATRFRAYFKEVTILIPSTWNMSAQVAIGQTFDQVYCVNNCFIFFIVLYTL